MSATYTHTRTTAPRYEIRGGPTGAVPCANVPHVAVTLKNLGAPLLSDAQVYSMVRARGAAARLPRNLSVHKLSVAERTARPPFRVTRTVELADGTDVIVVA